MPPVAVATDSTHYLPRELAEREGIQQVSLYVGWQGKPERELEMGGFDAFYERLGSDPELPTTSQPSIGDFLAVWEPLLDAGHDVVIPQYLGRVAFIEQIEQLAARGAPNILPAIEIGGKIGWPSRNFKGDFIGSVPHRRWAGLRSPDPMRLRL